MKIIENKKTFYKLKVGDFIKIKSHTEIKKTLNNENECNNVYFNSKMISFCKNIYTIKEITSKGVFLYTKDYNWHFIKEWFEIL